MEMQIRKGYKEKFKTYLTKAIELRQKGLKNERIDEYDDICYVLTDLLEDGMAHSVVLKDMVKNAAYEATTVDDKSFFAALDKLSSVVGGYESFYLVATANLESQPLRQNIFRIEDADVRVIDFNSMDKFFKVSSLFKEWQLFTPERTQPFLRYSYVVVEILASNAEEAFEKAFDRLELFRGLLNFAAYYGTRKHTFYGGIPSVKTLSILQPPRVIMLFDKNRNHLFDKFSIGFFDYSINKFETDLADFFMQLIAMINYLRPCALKERCLLCFRKYNDGLDGNVSGTAFLEFWKVFEAIAMADTSDKGMAELKVANRIASLFRGEASGDLMTALCDKRNYITHVGSLSMFDEDEINLIRIYCERAMMFLIGVVDEFEDEKTLGYFYDNIHSNDNELGRLEAVISKIKASRVR
jgi:hypothetical protein